MSNSNLINTLKVYQFKDIIKQHLIKNPDLNIKPSYANKLNKLGLVSFIKKNKITLADYPDYPKTSKKGSTNLLKKYNKSVYTEEEQKEFLNKEETNKKMTLNSRKNIQLQPHQINFIKQFIYSNLNGAIMFHGVGSGKTLTAVVCAYWYLKLYPNNKVICISPSALLYNFIEGMIQFGVPIKDNRYIFTTYDKYTRMSKDKKNAKNCLLIVDEAHNLRTEIKTDVLVDPDDPTRIVGRDARTNKRGFNILEYGALNADKILLLTGTAFVNSLYDIENLIAMIDKRQPILKSTFLDNVMSSPSNITDYFSYRISYVPSKASEFFPERREKLIFLPMSEEMGSEYNSFKNDAKNYFFVREKKINNVVKNEQSNPKIKWCIDRILQHPKQKFIIYTGMFDTGIKLLEEQLIDKKIIYTRITGRESASKKEANKRFYNAYDYNSTDDDKKCRILLISKAGAEGVDTKNSQNIILLDHQWNDALSEQIIARAIRYKSHYSLPIDKRYVNVFRLFLGFKTDESLFNRIEKGNIDFVKLNSEIRENVKEETRLLKKENNEFLPTVKLMKTLKEGDSDVLFVPDDDVYIDTRAGTFNKKATQQLYREGWSSYKKLETPDERKRWLVKNYSKWWSLYKNKAEQIQASSIDLRLYILCQAKLANINHFISYFGDDIVFEFEKYESKLLKKVMSEKIRLGRDGLTDEEENDIYIKELKDEKEDIKKLFFQNRKRTTKEQLQQYFTSPAIAQSLINMSKISEDTGRYIRILEPSAGDGSLIRPLFNLKNVNFKIDAIELDNNNRKILSELSNGRYSLNLFDHKNFLTYTSGAVYDYIFCNPPFHLRKNENPPMIKDVYDYDFILRAYSMLKPGGHLYAIIGKDWADNTPDNINRPDDNELLFNLKQITQFKKQKDAISFSDVKVSNTYFISIKKPIRSDPKLDDAILRIKYYRSIDNSFGQSLEDGEKSLKDILVEKTEKIKFVESMPVEKGSGLKYIKTILVGRNDYPPNVRNILKKYGNEVIVSYKLKRTPVSSLITSAMSIVSLGEFNKRFKNSDYDTLFHLFLEMTTLSGKRISVEKNEVINMQLSPSIRPNEEVEIITSNIPPNLTINSLMNNTRKHMRDSKFFNYSAKSSNCQDFILNILKANNIGDQSDIVFVKQDTDYLFKNLPIFQKIVNTTTTLGSRIDVIKQGAGKKRKKARA